MIISNTGTVDTFVVCRPKMINNKHYSFGKNGSILCNAVLLPHNQKAIAFKKQIIGWELRSASSATAAEDRIIIREGRKERGSGKRIARLKSSMSFDSEVTFRCAPAEDVDLIAYQKNGEVKTQIKVEEGFVVPNNNAFGQSFRDYDESVRKAIVEESYRLNHINQTYEFARKKQQEFGKLNRAEMSIWECIELLNEVIDESDPDLDEPQSEHLFQSAEAIRKDYPNEDWLHLTALIHDLGKVLLHPKFGEEPQWCVVGDTFPLGCAFDECIVYHKHFEGNPDIKNPHYSTKLGIYKDKCGLDKVTMSWGHDEYMYMVMKGNKTTLPKAALFTVRFHSFYPLHNNGAYTYLMNDEDRKMLSWVNLFNKYDLYSKTKIGVDVDKVKPYYQYLIEKYFPSRLKW